MHISTLITNEKKWHSYRRKIVNEGNIKHKRQDCIWDWLFSSDLQFWSSHRRRCTSFYSTILNSRYPFHHRKLKYAQNSSCSKFSKQVFKSTWTKNFQMLKLNLKSKSNQRSNCQHLLDHWESKRVPGKHLLLLYWLCQSLWLCGSQQTVENSSRDGNTRPPYLPP